MSGFRLVVGVLLTLFVSSIVFAQSARATGTVKDTSGRPIKGAIVRAINRDASPSEITSTTDDKGRWAMIGLRTGTWKFVAEAPGFTTVEANAPVRVAGTPPMGFALAHDLGPIPGALDKNVLQSVVAANTLRDRGQYDQALTAYQQIRD
jgi:Carboxypeptidase regulatory-like domain